MNQIKTFEFSVSGMHCKACEMLIDSELRDVDYVIEVKSSLSKRSVIVSGYFGDMTEREAAEALTKFIAKNGYSLVAKIDGGEKSLGLQQRWGDFKIAGPIAILFAVLFIALQKMGKVNIVEISSINFGSALVIGLIASLSTCMAVVGGLVLSMSATFSKEGSKTKPQILFHIGRIVSFFVLGGVIGSVGAVFTLSTSATFLLSLIIGIVMLIMGLNLLEVFHFSKKLQPSMPKFLSKRAHGLSKLNHSLTPLLVGVATFFLPCGFTQSMQIYTLTSGSFMAGGLTMLAFALGTLPVLALVSFSSFSINSSSKKSIFFKSAGLIVIMFAIFNLINSLAVVGILPPIFNF